MKVLMATFVLCAFCVFGLSYGLKPANPEHRERYALLKMIEYCDLVVKGEVSSIDYVVRQGVMPDGGGAFTTDITRLTLMRCSKVKRGRGYRKVYDTGRRGPRFPDGQTVASDS